MCLLNTNLKVEIFTFVEITLEMRRKYSCYLYTNYGQTQKILSAVQIIDKMWLNNKTCRVCRFNNN